MSRIKARLFVRADARQKPGGDVVQANAYIRMMRERGHDLDMLDPTERVEAGSIVHVFNLDRPWDTLAVARAAVRSGARVVLSTLLHPQRSVERYQRERSFPVERLLVRIGISPQTTERIKALARGIASAERRTLLMALRKSQASAQQELWALSSGIQLLSSREQAELRVRGFDAAAEKAFRIVRNGVTTERVGGSASVASMLQDFAAKHGKFAVVGGRIEPRKNQCELLSIFEELNIPALFAGDLNRRHRAYARSFVAQVSRSRSIYVGNVSRASFQWLLSTCHVHVSASLFEVSPLVDLEARALGAWAVSSEQGYGAEFLDAGALLCDPWLRESIRAVVARAWNSPERPGEMDVPDWANAAADLEHLYWEVLQ